MDFATPLGMGIAFVALIVSMIMDGGNPVSLLAPSSMILIFGGTIGVTMATMRLKDMSMIIGALKSAILAKVPAVEDSIGELVKYAEVARKEGLLVLESAAKDAVDPFMKKGLQMVVDGADPEVIHGVLEGEIDSMKARHRAAGKAFKDMGGYAPTIGILGTVMGLIHVLQNLNNPSTLGPAISGAFTATLWGVMTANLIWLPIEGKLHRLGELEARSRQLILDGIIAIQEGLAPRIVEQQLMTYIAPKDREAIESAKTSRKKAA